MKKIGIINITSYSGLELLRLLKNHPEVTITQATGRSMAGKKLSDVFPFHKSNIIINDEIKESVDLIFSCLPHKASAEVIGKYVNNGVQTIDLSADFRLPKELYESTYESKHPYPSLIEKFTYGLPELNREKIKSSDFISNPGCFPTCNTIPLIPLIGKNIKNIIIDSKTGTSGAGRSKKIEHSFSVFIPLRSSAFFGAYDKSFIPTAAIFRCDNELHTFSHESIGQFLNAFFLLPSRAGICLA